VSERLEKQYKSEDAAIMNSASPYSLQ